MDESEELQFIGDNLRKIIGFHPVPKCICEELTKEENKKNNKSAIEICRNGQVINLNPLYTFIQSQTQVEEFNINSDIVSDDVNNKDLVNKHEDGTFYTEDRKPTNDTYLKELIQKLEYDQNDTNDNYFTDLVQKLEYNQYDSFDRSILSVNDDLIVIDQVDSSLVDDILPKEDNINYSYSKQLKEKGSTIEEQSNKDDFISGVNIILDILKEDSDDPADESKKKEPVKQYMLPFVSEDKKENKDNNDQGWNYLKALETDEERYKFVRECWKSLVVPDPHFNLTHHGLLRRRQRAKGVSKDPGWPNNKSYLMEMSKKRKRTDEDSCTGNPNKKQRPNNLNLDFSTQRIEKAMMAVTENFEERMSRNVPYFKAEKLKRTYDEKIKALVSARHEVLMLHKFYSGLPDQSASFLISQQALENEQWDIEQLYERFKKHYKWDGIQFYP